MTSTPPHPLLRPLLRAPALFFRVGLGRVFGHRFLLLEHRGRKSGRLHRTPLEVVQWDAARHEATVITGWGMRSDWYRNIAASPAVAVRIGGARWPAPAVRFLTPDETFALLDAYRHEHRIAARFISRLLGWPFTATAEDFAAWAHDIGGVAFSPQSSASTANSPR